MDQATELLQMLNMLPDPAFAAQDGKILCCNRSAQALLAEPGAEVAPLLLSGQEEYAALKDGSLYLMLRLSGTKWGAAVTTMGSYHLFLLEQTGLTPELKAMGLLCSQLRLHLGDLTLKLRRSGQTDQGIRRELARMNRVLNNISNAERFALDDGSYQQERDACAVVEELMAECAALLEEANIHLRYTLPRKAVYTALDWQMLRQAIYALINNAAKNTASGGTILADLSVAGKSLQLRITDYGPGIPAEIRGTLFSRHTRQLSPADGNESLGLGLLLVRTAAIAHGGTVLVDQPQGAGTRVTLTLSIRPGENVLRTPSSFLIPSMDDGKIMLSNILPESVYE